MGIRGRGGANRQGDRIARLEWLSAGSLSGSEWDVGCALTTVHVCCRCLHLLSHDASGRRREDSRGLHPSVTPGGRVDNS